MDLLDIAKVLGIPGLAIGVWYLLERDRIKRLYVSQDKQTEALKVGFESIGVKIDTHALASVEAHGESAERISRIEGKLDVIARPRRGRK